jgi:hypothetical protein
MEAGAAGRDAVDERRGAGFDARLLAAGRLREAAAFRDAPRFFLADDFLDDLREAFLRAGMHRLPVRVHPAPDGPLPASVVPAAPTVTRSDRSGAAPIGSIMPYRIETAQGGP